MVQIRCALLDKNFVLVLGQFYKRIFLGGSRQPDCSWGGTSRLQPCGFSDRKSQALLVVKWLKPQALLEQLIPAL